MPRLQYIPAEPQGQNPLGTLLSSFLETTNKHNAQDRESDALSSIYKQYQGDGENLMKRFQAIQEDKQLSPTTKVNAIKQNLQFQQYNTQLQKKAQKDVEKAEKKANEAVIAQDLQKTRNLSPEQSKAYAANPSALNTVYPKEGKQTQASQPINEDQLRRIQHVESQPEFASASLPVKSKMFRDAGVSKENNDSALKPYVEEANLQGERGKILRKEQAKADIGFAQEQVAKIPQLAAKQRVFEEANILNEQGVTGQLWDQAMNKAGLLQFTSEGYRVFTSVAKDVIKNTGIKDVIGSQISQQEFKFFTDATINPNFSKEANRQIIRKDQIALRYDKLYADITNGLIEQNGGEVPERLQQKVNAEFFKQSQKLSKQLKEAAIDYEAIQNVPAGKVLMYDKKRRPLHVPADQVEMYSKPPYGATLS